MSSPVLAQSPVMTRTRMPKSAQAITCQVLSITMLTAVQSVRRAFLLLLLFHLPATCPVTALLQQHLYIVFLVIYNFNNQFKSSLRPVYGHSLVLTACCADPAHQCDTAHHRKLHTEHSVIATASLPNQSTSS